MKFWHENQDEQNPVSIAHLPTLYHSFNNNSKANELPSNYHIQEYKYNNIPSKVK